MAEWQKEAERERRLADGEKEGRRRRRGQLTTTKERRKARKRKAPKWRKAKSRVPPRVVLVA